MPCLAHPVINRNASYIDLGFGCGIDLENRDFIICGNSLTRDNQGVYELRKPRKILVDLSPYSFQSCSRYLTSKFHIQYGPIKEEAPYLNLWNLVCRRYENVLLSGIDTIYLLRKALRGDCFDFYQLSNTVINSCYTRDLFCCDQDYLSLSFQKPPPEETCSTEENQIIDDQSTYRAKYQDRSIFTEELFSVLGEEGILRSEAVQVIRSMLAAGELRPELLRAGSPIFRYGDERRRIMSRILNRVYDLRFGHPIQSFTDSLAF